MWCDPEHRAMNKPAGNHTPLAERLRPRTLAEVIGQLAGALEARQLLLAGGCFQNQLLLEHSVMALDQRGVQAFWPQQLPCNDAALPIGQLMQQIGG